MRQKWAFWAGFHKDGKARCSLYSHFPPWEKSWTKGASLGTELPPVGEGVVTRVKGTNLLTLFRASILRVFCSLGCWNLSAVLLVSHEGILIHGWLLKSVFLWGFEGWNLLFLHLADATLKYFQPGSLHKKIADNCLVVSKFCSHDECVDAFACVSWSMFKSFLRTNT